MRRSFTKRHTQITDRVCQKAGPKQVLEYLGRDTHRVVIANERIRDKSWPQKPHPKTGYIDCALPEKTGRCLMKI